MDEMDEMDVTGKTGVSSISSRPLSSVPPPSPFPLAEALAIWGRRRWWIAAFALAAALIGGTLAALRPPRYTCQVPLSIDVEAQLELFAARMAQVFDAAVPAALRPEIDRGAEAFAHLTGDRILDKNQTVEQYLTAWKANTLAALLAHDAVTDRLARDLGPRLEALWPEAAREPEHLRRWALRVQRDRPQSIVHLSFTAPDPDLARDGLAIVLDALMELEAAERRTARQDLLDRARDQARAAADILARPLEPSPGLEDLARRETARVIHAQATETRTRLKSSPDLIGRPLIAPLTDPSPPRLAPTRPILAAVRWLVAGALFGLLATALFTGVPKPSVAPCRPRSDSAEASKNSA